MRNTIVQKMASLAMFLALAVLLNYIENLIPVFIPVPGVKLGLANTLNLIILYFYGRKEYFAIGFLRVLLVSVMFTGLFTNGFFLSMSGFLLSSIIVIALSYIPKLSIFSLSVSSAVFHGVGQICCAVILYATKDGSSLYLFSYLPILVLTGTLSGVLIAFISSLTIKKLEKFRFFAN